MSIVDSVVVFCEQHHLLPESGVLIVAVSGGADSLCLLHLLYSLCGPGKRYPNLRLHVAHLNHHLREPVSSQDAEAVGRLARSWGLPVTIGESEVALLAQHEHFSLEEAARVARYRFLRDVASGSRIAIGHHQDDQVETLLLHWTRGGGIASMAGLQPHQQDIIRPLLPLTRADTLAYCAHYGLTPIEDASNLDLRYQRNRIRHELLPLLEGLNPGFRLTLLRTSKVMQTDLDWIETQIDACWPDVVVREDGESLLISRMALLSLSLSLQRHLWRRASALLCAGQSPLELRHYTLIEQALVRATGEAIKLDLPQRLRFERQRDEVVLHIMDEDRYKANIDVVRDEVLLPIPGEVMLPGTSWLVRAELVPKDIEARVVQALCAGDMARMWHDLALTRYSVYIDRTGIEAPLYVRTRRAGDRIRPLGMVHTKKVQDIFVDRHISRQEREQLPLFFSGEQCIWLGGVCIDDRVRLTGTTRYLLHLSMHRREAFSGEEEGLYADKEIL
ncbi:tRNA lysidine(34) synthetase TilS [Ktedonospora formicarum]|nr:tRNA lysidine(34) synthetase TilS [Ktedonospora formicarum]